MRWEDGDVVARRVAKARRDRARRAPPRRPRPGRAAGRAARRAARRGLGPAALDRARPGRCATGSPPCTARSATRGPTSPTTRCSPTRTAGGPGRSPRARRRADLRPDRRRRGAARAARLAGGRAGWTSWRRSGSPVPSGSRIAVDYSGDRPVLAVRVQEVFGWTRAPRPWPTGGCPSCCTCSPPPGARPRSPPTWRRSGAPATRRCAPSCAAATPSTPGRRTRAPREPTTRTRRH